ncbi:unnamed protein product [Rotaria sp. Silwood2]|nr:unnamed protein product [Rotaria sp. Silwood2]CAF4162255.1 unnamed protein product [Rotaria sp. Silwood2]
MEEYNEDFDFDHLYTNLNQEEEEEAEEMYFKEDMISNEDHDNRIVHEKILSQKFSQLLTKDAHQHGQQQRDEDYDAVSNNKRPLRTLSPLEVVSKKIRRWNESESEEPEVDHMPEYFERLNDMFDKIMTHHIIQHRITISIDDLRQLTISKHRIAMIELDKKLWTFYLKLGTGQCETVESNKTKVNQYMWPMFVKTFHSFTSNIRSKHEKMSEEKLYETIVREHLENLDEKIEFYLMEYHEKKNDVMNFTDDIEQLIETFVQQYSIVPFEMKLNYKIKILQYNYDDQLLERTYLQLNPTEDQIQIAKRLCNLRYAYVQAKQELIQLKQQILCNKPTKLIHSKALSMLSTIQSYSTSDIRIYQLQLDQEEKDLQEKMTGLMIESISEAENKILQYRTLLNKEIQRIPQYDPDKNEGLSKELMDHIHRRVDIINKKIEYNSNFRIHYCLQHHYTDLQDSLSISSICFSPTMIMSTPLHLLTKEQLQLLNRGPTYVPPYQMSVSSLYASMEEIIQKQHKSLQHDLNILFNKCEVNVALSMFIRNEIKKLFTKIFSISLPTSLRERALYEKQLVQSIREHLKANDLILRRTADQRNVFYLANKTEFEEKSNEYMIKMDTFKLCHIIDKENLQGTRDYLTTKMKSMNEQLQTIFSDKKYKDILKKLFITIDKVQLPYLYFLPNVSLKSNELSIQPIVVAQRSATARLAYFLEQLLRPIILRQLETTTFQSGADFIRKLNDYLEQSGHALRPTTNFVTIIISNFYSMVDHDTMLLALQDFLMDPCTMPTIQNISIGKVFRLTTLFLRHNLFYYDHKIYRFIKGSPTNFPIMETLATMYILPWLRSLFRQSVLEKEFYGRFQNQFFLTWNKTNTEFFHMIKMIRNQHKDIHLDIKIDSTVQFLHVHIENQNGTFYSRVDHDSGMMQKYTLPYVVGNSKVAHGH